MRMTLTTSGGQVIYLPEELALDDADLGIDLPGIVIPGRSGRRSIPHLKRLEPRTLRASGTIKECTREEADKLAAHLRGQLIGMGKMQLRRDAGDDRYIAVECSRVSHNYHRGHFGASLFTMNISFQADDPWWYAADYSLYDDPIDWTPPVTTIDVPNNGSAPVDPVIWLIGKTDGPSKVTNPTLTNYTTGQVIRYNGQLGDDEYLVISARPKRAKKIGANIVHTGEVQSATANSLTLEPGASDIDGAYVGHTIRITNGPGAGEIRKIAGYHGSIRTAVLDSEWDDQPDATSTYEIIAVAFLEDIFLHEAFHAAMPVGEEVLGDMSTSFMLDGFELAPGNNRIEVQDENELLEVRIIYRERWH